MEPNIIIPSAVKRKQSDDNDPEHTAKRHRRQTNRQTIMSSDEESDSSSVEMDDPSHSTPAKDSSNSSSIGSDDSFVTKDNKDETSTSTKDVTHELATGEHTTHEDVTHEDVVHEDVVHEDVVHEDVTNKDVAHMDTAHDGVTHDDAAPKNAAHEKAAHEDVTLQDVAHDTALVDNGSGHAEIAVTAPTTGPLSHPAIWKAYQYFRKAFPYGPEIFYQPFTNHGLGGFQAIRQSMAAQHPDLPIPTLTEFAHALKNVSILRLATVVEQPHNVALDVLSAAKRDGSGGWDPDCFNDDTRFLLQDHLTLVFHTWGRRHHVNVTLAIWTNGVPWTYKFWDLKQFETSTIVWIYHDGLHSYAGLGPLGSGGESTKALEFNKEELESYQKIVQNAGSSGPHTASNLPAEESAKE